MLPEHHQHLRDLAIASRLRSLQPRAGRDFASNDYLALASHPALRSAVTDAVGRGVAVGSGGSRLLRGNHPEHELLEAQAAAFFRAESSLYFSSGYAANAALLSTLPQRGDLVIHDVLVHASMHEGMRLGRAETVAVAHNDVSVVEDEIKGWRRKGRRGRIWIAVESLYSMDGDRAPLADLAALAERHDAMLLIDEAHATGVFGPDGQGLTAELEGCDNVITLHTCGKALGCEGALVCGPRVVRDFIVNRGRAFIFSTAPSPLMAAAVRAALNLVATMPERRSALQSLVAYASDTLADAAGVPASGSQIIPIVIGDDARTMQVAATLQAAGFDVRGIRPPTVPPGTARLRVSITLGVGRTDIDALAGILAEALAREPA